MKTKPVNYRCVFKYVCLQSLRPLPDKYHGLTDQETRYQRYLDLLVNDTASYFETRSKIIEKFVIFKKRDFLEVETL